MTAYCAFLRGINVNGVKMDMQALKDAFTAMGFLDAVTVLNTGNVVFTARSEVKALKLLLERGLSERFSYDAHVFLRSTEQIAEIIERSKLHPVPEEYHLYFLLCDDLNAIVALKTFYNTARHADYEELVSFDSGLLWQIPKGETLTSEFGKEALGRQYTASLTSRNMNTIEKVYALMKP